ncbi:MAG: hypothetical protein R2774_06185 [Saprospiraceae bacterium]
MRFLFFVLLIVGWLKSQAQYTPLIKTDSIQLNLVKHTYFPNQLRSWGTYKSLPIFCKIDADIYRKSKVNFAFRLGSLDYVNTLESK